MKEVLKRTKKEDAYRFFVFLFFPGLLFFIFYFILRRADFVLQLINIVILEKICWGLFIIGILLFIWFQLTANHQNNGGEDVQNQK